MSNETRWKQRYSNFKNAFAVFERRLSEYRLHPQEEELQLSLVQAYEFTFELAWKTIKDYLEFQGYDGITSPNQIIRQAFHDKIIDNGKLWLEALKIRNETCHVYAELILQKVLKFSDTVFSMLLNEFNDRFKNL